jgi:DNA polymerase-3 subunit alpha
MNTLHAEKDSGQESLFAGTDQADSVNRPPLIEGEPWDNLDKLKQEFDAVGFYLSAHPLDGLVEKLKAQKTVFFADLEERLAHTVAARIGMAGVLIKKQERISAKSGNKFAFLTLSDPTGVFEVMVFSETLAQSREFLKTGESLYVTVDAELSEQGQPSLRANSIANLAGVIDTKRKGCSIKLAEKHTPEIIQSIHDILMLAPNGHVRVDVSLPVAEAKSKVHFKIPGGYAITADTIKSLQNIEGIRDVIDL